MRPAITAERPRRCQAVRRRGGPSRQRPGHWSGRRDCVAFPAVRVSGRGDSTDVFGPDGNCRRASGDSRPFSGAPPHARFRARSGGSNAGSGRWIQREFPADAQAEYQCRSSSTSRIQRLPKYASASTANPPEAPPHRGLSPPAVAPSSPQQGAEDRPGGARQHRLVDEVLGEHVPEKHEAADEAQAEQEEPDPDEPEQPALLGFERSQGA